MASMGQTQPSSPTFGLALDFIVASRSYLSTQYIRQNLLDRLSRPYAGRCSQFKCAQRHRVQLPVCTGKYDARYWSIQQSSEIRLPINPTSATRFNSIKLHSFTIASPIGTYWNITADHDSEPGCTCLSPEDQVICVVERLQQINLANDDDILAIFTDHQCGLRVSIRSGNSDQFFRTAALKNVMKFMVLFEGQIDGVMQNPGRIRRGVVDVLAIEKAIHRSLRRRDLLHICERLATIYSAINIVPALRQSRTQTIEFTQHSGTLDIVEVKAWISACVGIVAWLEGSQYGDFFRYSQDRWYNLKLSLPEILKDIGVEQSVVEHYEHVLLHSTEFTYERHKYERTINDIHGHSRQELLQHAAETRYRSANRSTIGMVIFEKLMGGEYGWLPEGSPHQIPDFPIVSICKAKAHLMVSGESTTQVARALLATSVAIKNIPCDFCRAQLLALMRELRLPWSYRVTYLYKDNKFMGTAYADFRNPADAAKVIAAMHQVKVGGKPLLVEYKKTLHRVTRSLGQGTERDHRVISAETSSTERETASLAASGSTADAYASSKQTDQTSVLPEEGDESDVSGEDEYHSCLEWSSEASTE